jgi:site-specific DNA recombinase
VFDRLYVLCPDRLARTYAIPALLIEELQRAGVEIIFLNHSHDPTPEGQSLIQVQGIISEYERAKIQERNRRGKRHAARAGSVSVLGRLPFGYRSVDRKAGGGVARARRSSPRRPRWCGRSSRGWAWRDARCPKSAAAWTRRGS